MDAISKEKKFNLDEIILKIVKQEAYTDQDTENIRKEVFRKMGAEVTIQFVDAIPRTAMGKYAYFVQKLPLERIQLPK